MPHLRGTLLLAARTLLLAMRGSDGSQEELMSIPLVEPARLVARWVRAERLIDGTSGAREVALRSDGAVLGRVVPLDAAATPSYERLSAWYYGVTLLAVGMAECGFSRLE